MACNTRDAGSQDAPKAPQVFDSNDLSEVGHVIGVVSGKGGVGKSLVSCSLAIGLARAGYKVGVLDADITGPSVPHMMGLDDERLMSLGNLFLPSIATVPGTEGVKVMSANLLLARKDDPVLWRGPVLAGALKQFWSDTSWGPIDYLIVDMPPGTGDVALTVYQSLPIDGVVIVTSPQDLVSMIVGKAVKMAAKMGVGVLGITENLSYVVCPTDGTRIDVFGPSHLERDAELAGVPALDRLPIEPALAAACDAGQLAEALPEGYLAATVQRVIDLGAYPAQVPSIEAMNARADALGMPHTPADPTDSYDATPEEI